MSLPIREPYPWWRAIIDGGRRRRAGSAWGQVSEPRWIPVKRIGVGQTPRTIIAPKVVDTQQLA